MPFLLPTSNAQGHRYFPLSASSVAKMHTHVFFQEFYNFSTCLCIYAPFGVTFRASCVEGIQLYLTRLALQLSPWDLLERLEFAQLTAWHLHWKALSFNVRLLFWAWVCFLWPRSSPSPAPCFSQDCNFVLGFEKKYEFSDFPLFWACLG